MQHNDILFHTEVRRPPAATSTLPPVFRYNMTLYVTGPAGRLKPHSLNVCVT